jgi:hypothetical protein
MDEEEEYCDKYQRDVSNERERESECRGRRRTKPFLIAENIKEQF